MSISIPGQHFLAEADFTPEQWSGFLDLAADLKAHPHGDRLNGKSVALIFEKTSTRTRCAFEVAIAQQGGHSTYLGPGASQIGHKESMEDTARVLGRMYDAIALRGSAHSDIEILAEHAGVPVYNGLTDDWHPTQMLADALTIREHVAKPDAEVTTTYIGDARFNTGRSFLVSGALLGMDVRIIAPSGYQPPADVIDLAQSIASQTGARLTVTDAMEAVEGSDAVSTDVWVSMGEPAEAWAERIDALGSYAVTSEVMSAAGDNAIFMHCLPAFHDTNTIVGRQIFDQFGLEYMEVSDEVFRSPASVVFDQAENRLHTIKAVLVATL